MKVNYDEVMRMITYKNNINAIPLKDIEWVRDDGSVIEFDKRLIDIYKFTGLSNTFFAQDIITNVTEGKETEILEELKDLLQ